MADLSISNVFFNKLACVPEKIMLVKEQDAERCLKPDRIKRVWVLRGVHIFSSHRELLQIYTDIYLTDKTLEYCFNIRRRMCVGTFIFVLNFTSGSLTNIQSEYKNNNHP